MTPRDIWGNLQPSQQTLLRTILRDRDPYLLRLLESNVPLSPAQRTILSDHVDRATMAAMGLEWEPTVQSDSIEDLSSEIDAISPLPSFRGVSGNQPVDRYDEFGEHRPSEHPEFPLRPQSGHVYSAHFRARAFGLIDERGLDVTAAASMLGIPEDLLQSWLDTRKSEH